MNPTITHIFNNCKRYLLVISAVLLVVLSSCIVKSSLKTYSGIPINKEWNLPKSTHQSAQLLKDSCNQVMGTVYSGIVTEYKFISILFFAISFFSFLVYHFSRNRNKHPLYSSSSKIRNNIPLFLEYRKLVIHHK